VNTLDGYIRVSDVNGREGPSYISPDVQRAKIQAWADAKGIKISRFFKDEDKTGRNTDRPQFKKMMARVWAGSTGGVIVANTDRFSRDRADQQVLWRRIKEVGAVYVDASLGTDMPEDMTDLMLAITGMMAQLESDKIGGKWIDARVSAITHGVHIGHVPIGYEKPLAVEGQEHDRSLVPNSSAVHIRHAFVMRSEGKKLTEIADYLTEHTTPTRSKCFRPSSVLTIIRNRIYLGEVRSGDLLNTNAHEPIVTRALWESAQRSTKREGRHIADHLLTGIARCAGCRHSLRRAGRSNPLLDGDYRCHKNHSSGTCPDPTVVNQPEIERYVERQFLAYVKKLPEHPDFSTARRELDKARVVLNEWVNDMDIRDALGADVYIAGLRTRQQAVTEYETRYTSAVATSDGVDPAMVAESWDEMTRVEKRQAMGTLMDAVFVRNGDKLKDRVHICWRGEAADLPKRGHFSQDMESYSW
jgi:DNA invertase Pin-like site-specific DNA recombinase